MGNGFVVLVNGKKFIFFRGYIRSKRTVHGSMASLAW